MVAKNKDEPVTEPDDDIEEGAEAPVDPKSLELVTVRVLKKGDRQVHTGEHYSLTGTPKTHRRGAKFEIARGIAEELEDRGFVEIEGEEEAD